MPRQSRHKNVSFSNIYSLHEICVYQIIRKYTYKGVYFVIDDKFIIILKKFPDKYTPINLYTTIQYRTTQHSIKEAINESINRWRWCHHAYLCNITCNDALPSLLLHAIYQLHQGLVVKLAYANIRCKGYLNINSIYDYDLPLLLIHLSHL